MPKVVKMNSFLISMGLVLIAAVFLFTVFGCACKRVPFAEGFEDAPEVDMELSDKEQELFQNLKENKLSDTEITKLVKAGVLTDKLVEKFLEKLQDEDGDAVEGFRIGARPGGFNKKNKRR